MASPAFTVFPKCKVIQKLLNKSTTPQKENPNTKEGFRFYLNYSFSAWYTFLRFPKILFKAISLLAKNIRGEVITFSKDRFLFWSQLNMFHSFTSNEPHVVSHINGIVVLACVNTQYFFLLGGSGSHYPWYKDSNLFSVSFFYL